MHHTPNMVFIIRCFVILIIEFSEFTLDGQALFPFLDSTDYLCINIETLGNIDYPLSLFRSQIDFQPVTHIENLVHF